MISKTYLACCSVVLLVAVAQVSAGGAAQVAKLIRDLNKDYEKIAYPDNMTLEVGMTIVCAYMDEEHGRLSSRVIERYHWVDHRLRWDPKAYGGVEKVSVPDKYIWTPDVHLQNAIMHEDREEVNAVVLANGNVYWIPPVNYKTRCTHHDDHDDAYHCQFKLGSWTYDANSIPLELFLSGLDTKMYLDSCPYTVDNTKAVIKNTKYDCCPNPYATLNVEFDLHKKKEDKHDDDDDDEHHHGYKPRFSKDCEWPHCEE
jgi:hypothetical protein